MNKYTCYARKISFQKIRDFNEKVANHNAYKLQESDSLQIRRAFDISYKEEEVEYLSFWKCSEELTFSIIEVIIALFSSPNASPDSIQLAVIKKEKIDKFTIKESEGITNYKQMKNNHVDVRFSKSEHLESYIQVLIEIIDVGKKPPIYCFSKHNIVKLIWMACKSGIVEQNKLSDSMKKNILSYENNKN